MSRRVLKLSYDRKKVDVRYEEGSDEFEVISADGPAPRLVQALEALRPHVAAICELPAKYVADAEVRGVTFTYTKDLLGATITALKKVGTSNSPFAIHTPFTPESVASETDGPKVCLSEDATLALMEVQEAALDYVDGRRAQLSLLEEEPAGAAK